MLGLIIRRHFLGVAASSLRLFELVVLDRKKLGAKRFDLFLGGGTNVGGGDDGAHPARGGDGLKARDANPHDEDARGGNCARRRHHHRQGAAIFGSSIDDGAITSKVCLRGQNVHHLRAGDARHQLHAKQAGAGRRYFVQSVNGAIGIGDADDSCAWLDAFER